MWIVVILGLTGALGIHLGWRRRYRGVLADIAGMHRLQALLREQHRQELERENARQPSIFDSMMEGVAVLDHAGRVVFTNLAFRRFLHITEDLRGRDFLESLTHPGMRQLADTLRKQGLVVGMEITMAGPPVRILHANANRLSGDLGSLVVLHDHTRLKEMERTRREFVANVSHELRTPISLIKGFVETLQHGAIDDPATARKFLQTIQVRPVAGDQ